MMNPLDALNSQGPGVRRAVVGFRSALLVLLALSLFACAGTGGGTAGSGGSGGVVVERAIDRWDKLLEPNYDAAYDYYSPGYRSSTSRGDFELSIRLRKVQFTDAEYQEHECTENACTLKFKTFYTIASPVPGIDTFKGNTITEEKWIKTDGQWWFLPDN